MRLPILALCALCASCSPRAEVITEGAHWNEPGSRSYRLVVGNTAYMDAFAAPTHELNRDWEWQVTSTNGYCTSRPPYIIAVYRYAPAYVIRHEFCHLIDRFSGHWDAALASLGPNVPADIMNFCVALSHCDPGSNYQWIELQRENPLVDVIQHDSIKRDIHQYDIAGWK